MSTKKGVVLGVIGGVAGIAGLSKLYNLGYKEGAKKTKDVYDAMFDMFRELEKEHEQKKDEE